jgi:hypothetical protein
MKFYYLDTKFTSGRYKGQTLEEVYAKDPEYIETSLKEDDNFLLTEEVIDELQTVNADYSFSDEAIAKRDSKEKEFDRSSDADDDDEFEDGFDDEDFDEDFDIEDIDEEDLEDLDDLYDDDDDDYEEDDFAGDFDDFADDSAWDRF